MDIEQIREYCLSKPYATEDMPFGPEYVVFRIGGKIFCCLALVLGNVVQLKWNPEEFDEVIDKYSYVSQAWHWHKRHMIQFDLSETPIPDSIVKELIDRAYSYVRGKLPKTVQNMMTLKEMTLEELWKLFPITLTQYNPQWKRWAEKEILLLSRLLANYNPTINHTGSTAIPGIVAKPIVDILVEIPNNCDWSDIKDLLEQAGYICMSDCEDRMSFNKGYTPEGYANKVFHIHIHNLGDNDEIVFRDYLIQHPTEAKEYEQMKLSLLPKFKNDRDGYTSAKSDFINSIISRQKLRCTI